MRELRRLLEAAGRVWIRGTDEYAAHRALLAWMERATAELERLDNEKQDRV